MTDVDWRKTYMRWNAVDSIVVLADPMTAGTLTSLSAAEVVEAYDLLSKAIEVIPAGVVAKIRREA